MFLKSTKQSFISWNEPFVLKTMHI